MTRQLLEPAGLLGLPGGIAAELISEDRGDARGGGTRGAGVEDQGAGAAGEHVFDRPRPLVAGRPDDLARKVGERRVDRRAPVGTLCDQSRRAGASEP